MALLDAAYILAAVRDLLNEQSSVIWTDDQINKWVQEAAMDISTKTLGYEDNDVIETVANTLESDEPSGTIKVHSCILGGSSGGCVGTLGSVIDSLEFETSYANWVSICHVSGNIYAVAYQGPDLDGWLATVEIDTAGNIAATVEDTWEWDTTQATYAQIVKMQTGIFAIAYSDSSLDGWIFTFAIAADGTITKSKIASEEFNITLGYPGKLLRIDDNLAVLVYCGPGGDGWCETFTIDDAGAITQTDSLEFDGATGAEPWICHVSGEVYAVAYRGPGDDGWVKTFSIDSSGNISAAVIDSLEFDTGTCYEPSICKATGNYFVVAYRGAGAAGKLHVIEIDTSGNITDPVKDSYTFQASNCYFPEVVELGGGYVAIAYGLGGGGAGYIKTILVDSAGDMGDTILDTLEFDAARGGMPRLYQLDSTCNYAIAFVGPDDDGWIKTFDIAAAASSTDYKGLSKVHPRLIHHVSHNDTGEPIHYYHHHGKIGIWPLPDDAYPITVYSSKVTDDITDLPSELRLLAIPYCLAMARLSEGWEDDFEMFITMYLNSLMAYRADRGEYKLNTIDAKDKFQIPLQKVVNG